MGGILDKLDEWLRGLLIDGITGKLSGMFDTVNTKVGEIAGEVGQTPLAWNSGVFSMIRNLSETVIVPIAGVNWRGIIRFDGCSGSLRSTRVSD